ncbi:MAG: hypothetical protein HFI19_09250 [Lachnospiraceae bacterium]|nr:hypothetical protein [Lachnospiraceae bacterium]
MGKIPRDSWAIIERVIRRYPESKKEYEERYKDLIGTRTESLFDGGASGNASFGNPTEKAALKLNSPRMVRIHREVEAVEAVYSQLSEEHQKVIRIRFWSGRKRNTPYFQMESAVNYKEAQMRRISGNFIKKVGMELGEI